MGPLTLALLLVAVLGVAFAMARVAERRRGEGWDAVVFAGVVAVPFWVLTISPLLTGDDEKGAGSSNAEAPTPQTEATARDWCASSPRRCQLRRERGQGFKLVRGAIRSSRGPPFVVVPGRVSGFIEDSKRVSGHLRLSGWAANTKDNRPASWIFVFAGPRFLGRIKPNQPRPDVARAYDPRLKRSGFTVDLPDHAAALKVYGAERHIASPLTWAAGGGP